jgi:DNA-binding NtrC family response regulator
MRTAGKPFGIEPSAYTQLADYEFPGDVAELWVLIERLVAGCRGDTVRVADVELLRLGGPARRSGVSGGHVRKDPISA